MGKSVSTWLASAVIVSVLVVSCSPRPSAPPAPPAATAAPTPAPTVAAPAPTLAPPTLAPATPRSAPATPPIAPATPAPAPAVKLPATLSIATAGVGTTSYISGSAFAEVLQKYLPMKVAIEPSGATSRWVPLMKTGEIDLAIGCSPGDVRDAYFGEFFWKDKGPQPVVQVAIGHVQPYGFNVTDPKIKTIADLKGKKVYITIRGMRTQDAGMVLLREAGLKPGDVEVLTFADINEAAKGIAEGKAVGVFYLPSVLPVVELDRSKPLYALPVPEDMAKKVMAEFPEFGHITWKKGEGIAKEDVPFLSLPCLMSGRADLSPDVAYTILNTIYSHYDEYKDKHPIMKWWTPEQAVTIHATPFHTGSIKYFKEKGVWKADHDKVQQQLLSRPR